MVMDDLDSGAISNHMPGSGTYSVGSSGDVEMIVNFTPMDCKSGSIFIRGHLSAKE